MILTVVKPIMVNIGITVNLNSTSVCYISATYFT